EKRVDEDCEENDGDAVTAAEPLQCIDREKDGHGQTAAHPGEESVVDRLSEVDLGPSVFGNRFGFVIQQPVILGTHVELDLRSIRSYWEQPGNQLTLFRFVAGLLLVSDRAKYQPGNGTCGHGNHPKVGVADSGPLNRSADVLQVRTFGPWRTEPTAGIFVNRLRGKSLRLAVHDRDAFGCDGVKSVVLDS